MFEKYSNIKFNEKSLQWKPSCSCRLADKTKLKVTFRNLANAYKNRVLLLLLKARCNQIYQNLPSL